MNDSLFHPNDTYFSGLHGALKADRTSGWQLLPAYLKEMGYQVSINLVLLVLFSFNLDETEYLSARTLFTPQKLAFFGNYLAAATVINYVLLPYLYYKKRTIAFVASVVLLLTVVILIDESILEQIFFPDTRGTYFPGLLFTLVETLPIIIIMVAFKLAWDFNKKQREVENLKSLVRESEILFLKSQINPHFLFNNLNNLYAYAIDNSPRTPSIILDLATVLRYMLYDCKEDYVALSKEIQHLKNYTALYQLQIEKRGKVSFHDEIINARFAIPPLILVVFVENAFKHSTGSQGSDIEIDIHIHVSEEGQLTFLCSNNYSAGYRATDTAQGIGLKNVRKRLDLLYPKLYALAIQDDGNIFTVKLTMPLKPTMP